MKESKNIQPNGELGEPGFVASDVRFLQRFLSQTRLSRRAELPSEELPSVDRPGAHAPQALPEPESTPPSDSPAPKRKRTRMTLLKRLEGYISAIFKLGRTERLAKRAHAQAGWLQTSLDTQQGDLERMHQEIGQGLGDLRARNEAQNRDFTETASRLSGHTGHLDARLSQFEAESGRMFSDLTRRMDRIMLHSGGGEPAAMAQPCEGTGFEAFLERYYNRLEARWRGSRADIRQRLSVYLPEVEAAFIRSGNLPVLDLGCGRGEWLELMRERRIRAIGVDPNRMQIGEARELGLDARAQTAAEALAEAGDNSVSAITAHHLIEHLPFRDVAWIVREALRVLAPGGVLIFETPNPRNILVGASSFYNDPTHIAPLPDTVLTTLFDCAGFNPVEARPLHPHERFDEFRQNPGFSEELAHILFGPQDLAVLGHKPVKDT